MKYRIECNSPVSGVYSDYVLLDYDREGCELPRAVLTRGFNGNLQDGTLSFSIHYNHPYYDKVLLSVSTISVYDDNVEVFRGRAVNCEIDKFKTKTFTCESMMKFLIDVPDVFSTADADGNVDLSNAIPAIINGYNSYADDNRKIYLAAGSTITGKAQAQKGQSVYSCLSTWLASAGYYAKIAFNNNRYELSLSTDTGVESDDFKVVFGENVMDYLETVNLNKLYTAVYPVGVDSSDDNYKLLLNDRTIFSSLTQQTGYSIDNPELPATPKNLIYHDALITRYGSVVLFAEIDMKDRRSTASTEEQRKIDESQIIYDEAIKALKNANGANDTFTISAVDPRLVGIGNAVPIEGNYYPVSIPLPTDDTHQKLTKIDTDMTKPSAGSLSFGGTRNLLTDQSAAATVAAGRAGAAANSAQKTANSANGKINYVDSVVETGITNDGWTYRKWKSGARECWKKVSVSIPASAFSQVTTNLYAYNAEAAYPTGFFGSAPAVFITPDTSTYTFWTGNSTTASSQEKAVFRMYRHTNPASEFVAYINIYAILKGGNG